MILVTERNNLAAALGRVAGIIESRNTIPILANVLLTTESNTLTLRATNLDMEAVEIIPAAIGEPGATTISASLLTDLARSLPEGAQIGMKLAERLQITSGRTRVNLATLPPDHFPQLWSEDWPQSFSVEAEILAAMLDRVSYAQSEEASRAYIQGVNFATMDGRLRLVGTNTHIISLVDGPKIPDIGQHTVPTRMVTEMSKLLAVGGQAMVSFSDNKVALQVGSTTVTSKLIDRSLAFPNYQRVIPADPPLTASMDIASALSAMRRASVASQGIKDNLVMFTFKNGAIAVTARNSEADALDEIDAEYEGEEIGVPLNLPYMLDILGAMPDSSVTVSFTDSRKAMIWRGDEDGLVVIAPLGVG